MALSTPPTPHHHRPSTELVCSAKLKLDPLNTCSLPHLPPPLGYLKSLWIWLFQEPQVRGVMQSLFFCDWLTSFCVIVSRLLCVVACVRIPVRFMAEWYSSVCTRPCFVYPSSSLDIWVLPLGAIGNSPAMHMGVQKSFERPAFTSSGISWDVKLLD